MHISCADDAMPRKQLCADFGMVQRSRNAILDSNPAKGEEFCSTLIKTAPPDVVVVEFDEVVLDFLVERRWVSELILSAAPPLALSGFGQGSRTSHVQCQGYWPRLNEDWSVDLESQRDIALRLQTVEETGELHCSHRFRGAWSDRSVCGRIPPKVEVVPQPVAFIPSSSFSMASHDRMRYYGDRYHTFIELPDVLNGTTLIRTSIADYAIPDTNTTALCFSIDTESVVYVLYPSDASRLPAWMCNISRSGEDEDRCTYTWIKRNGTDPYTHYGWHIHNDIAVTSKMRQLSWGVDVAHDTQEHFTFQFLSHGKSTQTLT